MADNTPTEPELFDGSKTSRLNEEREHPSVGALASLVGQTSSSHLVDQALPIQELFIPVHGFVRLTNSEVRILDHPAVQRLGMIHQLGQSHLVYRGGTHRRLEHSIGTLHVAQVMLDAIASNHRLGGSRTGIGARLAEPPTPVEVAFVRLAALLHDVGHLPAGHTLEDELRVLERHDGIARLNLVLDRNDWPGYTGPTLRSIIDEEFGSLIPGGSSATDTLLQIIAKDPKQPAASGLRIGICRDIVGNTICADLLDYLYRDWYHIGKPQHFESRILQYMEIRESRPGAPHQFVVSLGARPRIRTDAISAILSLLESRYQLAEIVLFHRTKCAAAAMLERAIQEIRLTIPSEHRAKWRTGLEKQLLDVSDEGAMDYLRRYASRVRATPAQAILNELRRRSLHQSVYSRYYSEFLPSEARRVMDLYAESDEAPVNRLTAVRLLELDFGLPAGSLVLYCPDKRMNAKIAEVKIQVDGIIEEFSKWETDNSNELSGGHLTAQLHRFQRLWRIHVFLAREEARKMSTTKLERLREAIESLIVGRVSSGGTVDDRATSLATLAAKTDGMPCFGMEVEELVGARSPVARERYPSGAPTIQSFFRELRTNR